MRVRIHSLDCENCARAIARSLRSLSGVNAVRVSFESAEAVIEHEPAESMAGRVVERIAEEGYFSSAG